MNPKFFDVKKEKQDAIINAALMIFAENGYRKASTDVIVKEAGISKGLLFHYFTSKQGMYEFIYDYSVKYMMLELTQSVKKTEKDFFEIQRQIELAKTRVMKNYPYMQQFLSSIKYETHADALSVIKASDNMIDDAYANIYKQADMTKFYSQVDMDKVIKLIGWMSDGFIKDKFREGAPDLDVMNEEFAGYLAMIREHFYKGTGQGLSSIESEEIGDRDDSVMESMKSSFGVPTAAELSFEERLAAGKKPVYELPPEEKEEETVEEPIEESAEEVTEEDSEVKETLNADEAVASVVEAPAYEQLSELPELDSSQIEELSMTNLENSVVYSVNSDSNTYSGPVISSNFDDITIAAEPVGTFATNVVKKPVEFDVNGLEDKIIDTTSKEEAEREEAMKDLGPAPVLPDFDPESFKKKEPSVDEVIEEEEPLYYPLRF